MTDTLVQALVMHLESNGYPEPQSDQRVHITLGVSNGIVIRGTMINADRFMAENSWAQQGHWPNPDAEAFAVPLRFDPPTSYVHLMDVEYLTAGGWIAGGTARVSMSQITFSGEKSSFDTMRSSAS